MKLGKGKNMKKEWKKPVVTIVAKSTTEENVLAGCKVYESQPSGGPESTSDWCGWFTPEAKYCKLEYSS